MKLLCPACREGEADWADVPAAGWRCPGCGFEARRTNGVLDLLTQETQSRYAQFFDEYLTIRKAEGRGSDDPAYYRALPFEDVSGKLSWQWAMRAKTYRYFERRILEPLERDAGRPLEILDLGAGVGWLSYRLERRGHRPVAVDLLDDKLDGLGAARHYEASFPALRGELDRLPVAANQFDLAVYNASFHYAVDYWATLQEARRTLGWGGRVVILDTPVYRRAEHGEQMREERHRDFERRYGFRSDSILSMEYLDEEMLARLSKDLNVRWTVHRPWYGLGWALRPWRAALADRRPPSRFWALVGSWTTS